MTEAIRWHRGNATCWAAVERWLTADRRAARDAKGPKASQEAGDPRSPGAGRLLRDNPRRRLLHWSDPEAGELLIKQFRAGSGRHALRERWKARLGRSPAAREARALARLEQAGVAVPSPLALATLANGDRLLVQRFVPGPLLLEGLAVAPPLRRARLRALGEGLARLHAAGFVHGDLHPGNILMTEAGPVFVDLQHARRSRSRRRRLADLGRLDSSLWSQLAVGDRMRLRAAALGLSRPFDATARAALRAAGRAAERHAAQHARSRTRRALRPGRRFARFEDAAGRGMRLREIDAEDLARALAAHRNALATRDPRVLKDDGRSRISAVQVGARALIVKQVLPRGLGRRLADAWRGSPGRRAWRAGHGLQARGVGAALPFAYVEQRRLGLPASSAVVLEDLRPAATALDAAAREPGAVTEALTRLLVTMHRRGVDHGDLKATHIFLIEVAGGFATRLIDLEGVRFPRRLSAAQRLEALVQLNASLPDDISAALRCQAFARYAGVHRFAGSSRTALGQVATLSLARKHRWSGADCPLVHGSPRANREG